jgi:hypothetical protein
VLRITPNPWQRAAVVCVLIAAVVGIVGSTAASLPVLAVAFELAVVAVSKRGQYRR